MDWTTVDGKASALGWPGTLQQSGASASGTEVLAIHRANSDRGALQSYIDAHTPKYRIAEDGSGKAKRKGPTFAKYGVRSVPAIYIVDADGKVQYQDIPEGALERALAALSDETQK